MSFILDALKKSESERHRNSGPVLMDVRIAPPRRRLPAWAWVIAAVLLVNLLLLAWLLWLAPPRNAAPRTTVAAPASTATPPAESAVAPPAAAPAQALPPPTLPPATTPSITSPDVVQSSAVQPSVVAPAPAMAAAPAVPEVIDASMLPRVQDLAAAGLGLPDLRLSLHVFDAVPASRYVLLNGAKLREGDFTPEGVRLLQITPAGAVLEWRGRRMFLGAGG